MNNKVLELIRHDTGIAIHSVKRVIELLEEGATIPFIARYRKEKTGSLDEVQLADVKASYDQINKLILRKVSILENIESQGKLTPTLRSKIEDCWSSNILEDLYLPFKKKRQTKGSIARENGLEHLAKIISAQKTHHLENDARKFISKNVKTIDAALEGARYIIAEWINENATNRDILRRQFERHARIESKVVKKKKEEASLYKNYFEHSELLSKCPSHRFLAIYRGSNEGMLRMKISIDETAAISKLERYYVKTNGPCAVQLRIAIKDSLKRLLLPAIETEFKSQAKKVADTDAIEVFSKNLKQLLLAAPLGNHPILALDPGYRTGCKITALDEYGMLLKHQTIFPHPPQKERSKSEAAIKYLLDKFHINHIAIGNGTAGKESYHWLKKVFPDKELYLVNESGASIYSASEIARKEFPKLDLTYRGAISIGRRLMDPLAELVKIDAKSIGVGQYQHDVNQPLLQASLTATVESCVNSVGINLNSASEHLLSYISGVGPTLAANIVSYRNEIGGFTKKDQLKKVPRMGAKAFQQSSGFLRIRAGKEPLDNTGIHPERFVLVKKILSDYKIDTEHVTPSQLKEVNLNDYVSDDIGLPTLQDIVRELSKPGLDPRGEATALHFSKGLESIEDIKPGMTIQGVVNNLTKFGAFVDMGIKESGLIHISQITDQFIKDPADHLQLNQEVTAKVIEVDVPRKRISLTLKF